jgi:hypothetical protein
MPDASGLNQQQAIAAQEPYKNIALGNPAETFLNAWALTTGLKLKKDEFQGKMQALAMKNQQLEQDSQLKEREFGMRMAMMQQGMGLKEQAMDLQGQRFGLAQDIASAKLQGVANRDESRANVAKGLADLSARGITQGSHEYWTAVNQLLADNPNMPASEAVQVRRQGGFNFNNSVDAQNKSLDAREKELTHRMSNTLYGTTANTDLLPVTEWQTHTQPDYAPRTVSDWWQSVPPKETDQRIITIKDATGKVTGTRKVPTATLTDFNKQWQDLQAQRNAVPKPIYDPSSGITPTNMITIKSSSGRTTAQIPNTPEAIQQAKQLDPGLTIVP